MAFAGFDIGTSFSGVSIWTGREARMIEIGAGIDVLMPSVVTVSDGVMHIGEEALREGVVHPEYCYRHFKRRLAQRYSDMEDMGPQVVPGDDGSVHYAGPEGHTYSPIELYAYLIQHLVEAANRMLADSDDEVTGAVIGIPADFTRAQEDAVLAAAQRAGLPADTTFLMREPTAAALAYGHGAKKTTRIAVYDLGGGTFDVSIVQTGGGLVDVIATNGLRARGGKDFDKCIADYVINRWKLDQGDEAVISDGLQVKISIEAEAVKKRLTEREETTFRVEDAGRSAKGVQQHMIYPISRKLFEELTADIREELEHACEAVIQDARRTDPKFSVKDLPEILPVGGMTRVPSIMAGIKSFFGKAPRRDETPEWAVAKGLAIMAAIKQGRLADVTIADITSHTIAIERVGGVATALIAKGSTYPLNETFNLKTCEDGQTSMAIRIIQGEAGQAIQNELLYAGELACESSAAGDFIVEMHVEIDAGGRPTIRVGELELGGVA